MVDVLRFLLGRLLVLERGGRELDDFIPGQEHPQDLGHDPFDGVPQSRIHDLRATVYLVAVGLRQIAFNGVGPSGGEFPRGEAVGLLLVLS
jgi:hypothetical protein